MHRHFLHLAADLDTNGGDLLKDLGIDMLDLDCENVAHSGKLADFVRVLERACDVLLVLAYLASGAVGFVEHCNLDAKKCSLLVQHTPKLPTAQKTNNRFLCHCSRVAWTKLGRLECGVGDFYREKESGGAHGTGRKLIHRNAPRYLGTYLPRYVLVHVVHFVLIVYYHQAQLIYLL